MGSKFLCPDCLVVDDGFNELISSDKPLSEAEQSHAKNAIAIPEAPKTVRELPHALHEMFSKGPLFYKTALNTPFPVSYLVAFLALLPSTVLNAVLRLPKLAEVNPDYAAQMDPAVLEMIKSFSIPTLIFIGILATAIQVLLLDAIYFVCVRAFSSNKLTWNQTSSTLHYCLTPLLLSVIGIIAEMEIIYLIALVVMVIKTTTATMITTQSTFLKGFLIMFMFIGFVLMLHVL